MNRRPPISTRTDTLLPYPALLRSWMGRDASGRSSMAASILAKVARDRVMRELHEAWPQYGFDLHKGYSTPTHLASLRAHGPCPQHRRSFAPVREALACAEAASALI